MVKRIIGSPVNQKKELLDSGGKEKLLIGDCVRYGNELYVVGSANGRADINIENLKEEHHPKAASVTRLGPWKGTESTVDNIGIKTTIEYYSHHEKRAEQMTKSESKQVADAVNVNDAQATKKKKKEKDEIVLLTEKLEELELQKKQVDLELKIKQLKTKIRTKEQAK